MQYFITYKIGKDERAFRDEESFPIFWKDKIEAFCKVIELAQEQDENSGIEFRVFAQDLEKVGTERLVLFLEV